MFLANGEIHDQTWALSRQCVSGNIFLHALGSRLIARLYCNLLQTQPSVKSTLPVQACGIAGRQSGSDKPLTETWLLICYHWKGKGLINTEQISEKDHPSGNAWKILYMADWYFCLIWDLFPGFISLFPQNTLAHSSDTWMSLSVMESEAFYIRSVPGDGFSIIVSLCELLPKMSNPLQACL